MPAGRPLKFKTVKELEGAIDNYLNTTPKEDWTITGLAIALGTFRKVLCEYEGRDEYSNTIKKAKQMVEHSYEIDLKKSGRSGTIFALKNFDWKDKTESDTTIHIPKPILDNVLPSYDGDQEDIETKQED